MRVTIDASRCQGHARCHAVAPEVFELDDDGFVVLDGSMDVPEGLEAQARRGVGACPERALSLSD